MAAGTSVVEKELRRRERKLFNLVEYLSVYACLRALSLDSMSSGDTPMGLNLEISCTFYVFIARRAAKILFPSRHRT